MKAHEKTHETFRHQKFCQGPKVGGDQVWAYNGGNVRDNPAMPPTANWKVQNVGWPGVELSAPWLSRFW